MPQTLDPATAAATYLASAGVGLTLGTNLFIGEMRPASDSVPSKAVFVQASGGPAPIPYLATGRVQWHVNLNVYVRSDPNDYQSGESLMRSVTSALLFIQPSASYIAIFSDSSAGIYLGEDSNARAQWLQKCSAWWVE